ncbi:alpha-glucuronidase family glycosyl hydrolase [Leeuwenhoekiella polynyae]|uniref:Xylan alpha-1,2-glucuronidase n=1 Tax=Leeuwenhoekiella polynyae TaxID=1550906 RepID=A0A4V1KQQ2_9FLAO|nr:alpha-glucuronidase family glycosyl hydrolase [Leeuwenhoekiella polynyae]RXG22202.1 alpha-glucuronidase [Leeuwenhoekiella polynyae]
MKKLILGLLVFVSSYGSAQDGYKLWLQYKTVDDAKLRQHYSELNEAISLDTTSSTGKVIQKELKLAMQGMLSQKPQFSEENPTLLIRKVADLPKNLKPKQNLIDSINDEGFSIQTIPSKSTAKILITAKTDQGLLYGVFTYLKQLQLHKDLTELSITDSPKIKKRLLNHWDNLDRTIERGYAGFSIWDWHLLPNLIKQEYIDYARANASIGINGTVLTNVNASAYILQKNYLEKVKALADAFRPYGIQVYLTARFSAPIEIGGLETADPLNEEVRQWWKDKATEIYAEIPDFGGFLVKANSEGQPGPNNYNRSHVDGANMLAEAVAPHDGIVMWRAFVYSDEKPDDRAKQAYTEFVPFDGTFKDNVLVQVKNGAIDFQPREPFHPLFGAMPETPLMMEFQITQEYLGGMSHLVFLPKLFEETLQEDTFSQGKGSTVAKVVAGSLTDTQLTGIAGVSNIGNARNWTGHPFAQANWYGFGRLAWNPELKAKTIAQEWLGMTFSTDPAFVKPMTSLLLDSREAVVDYMTPLGLHHMMAEGHHQGPGPWVKDLGREDWTSVYYHKADSLGIGFDRTATGSDALSQYAPEIEKAYSNIETTPEKYLLWFHHVPWGYKLKNGKTLWYNLARHYQDGVLEVEKMINTWEQMKPYVDEIAYKKTEMLLSIQLEEAQWWRDSCLLYFQQFSKMELPDFIPKAPHTLKYYESIRDPYAPGIKPSWD